MPITYNIYCDESCHLEKDHIPVMVIGAVWCPAESSRELSKAIRYIKEKHHLEFAVILAERRNYYLLKTAYVVKPHREQIFRKEFEKYWKAKNG